MPSRTTGLSGIVVCVAMLACAAYSQIADSAPDVVAGIPVNYTEADSGAYTLPDALKLNNGQPVRNAKTWLEKRRPEIRKLIEENWYGRAPGRPKGMTFEVVEQGSPAFEGKALRRQITIHFASGPARGWTCEPHTRPKAPAYGRVNRRSNRGSSERV